MDKYFKQIAIGILALTCLAFLSTQYYFGNKTDDILGVASFVKTDTGSTTLLKLQNLVTSHNALEATTTMSLLTSAPNLATVGTITAGTWSGTAIADAKLTKTGDWTGTLDSVEGSAFFTEAEFLATTTDTLDEGSTNKYWSNTLFDNRLAATTSLPKVNAGTASALASNPTDCGAGEYANAVDASGNLTCAAAGSSAAGLQGQVGYYASDGSTLSGTSTIDLSGDDVTINPLDDIRFETAQGTITFTANNDYMLFNAGTEFNLNADNLYIDADYGTKFFHSVYSSSTFLIDGTITGNSSLTVTGKTTLGNASTSILTANNLYVTASTTYSGIKSCTSLGTDANGVVYCATLGGIGNAESASYDIGFFTNMTFWQRLKWLFGL